MKRFLAMFAVVALMVPMTGHAANKNYGSKPYPCGDNGTITVSPNVLWPPNHKLQPITFDYKDPDGGDVTLTVTAKPHSDTLEDGTELNGTGNTPPASDQMGGAGADVGSESDGEVIATGSARSERSGHSMNGRTYSFEYTATNDSNRDGQQDDGCMSDPNNDADDITVFVPHDCRGGVCKG